MKILVVDDDPCLGRAIRRALSGHDVTVEVDPVAAIALVAAAELAQAPFELVLCDFKMPGMNGVDVMMAVRARSMPPLIIFDVGR